MTTPAIVLFAILWHIILVLVVYLLYKRYSTTTIQDHVNRVELIEKDHEEQLKELEVLFKARVNDDEKIIRGYEEIIEKYQLYYVNFSNIIRISDERIKLIDSKGSFKSDDEVGFFFNNLKEIQNSLNAFDLSKVVTPPVQELTVPTPSPIKDNGTSNVIEISEEEAERFANSKI